MAKWDKRRLYVAYTYNDKTTSPYSQDVWDGSIGPQVLDFFPYNCYSQSYGLMRTMFPDSRIYIHTYRDFKNYHPTFFMKE